MEAIKNESKTAAKNTAVVLSALNECGTTRSGRAIGKDASFISRLRIDEKKLTLSEWIQLMSFWRLEISQRHDDVILVDRAYHESLKYLAKYPQEIPANRNRGTVTIDKALYESLCFMTKVGLHSVQGGLLCRE
jgi:hypothetical protein